MKTTDKVYEIIKQSKNLGLPYIAYEQIVSNVKNQYPNTSNIPNNVSQALYHLQQEKKLRPPRIRKVYHRNKFMGYTTVEQNGDIEL